MVFLFESSKGFNDEGYIPLDAIQRTHSLLRFNQVYINIYFLPFQMGFNVFRNRRGYEHSALFKPSNFRVSLSFELPYSLSIAQLLFLVDKIFESIGAILDSFYLFKYHDTGQNLPLIDNSWNRNIHTFSPI